MVLAAEAPNMLLRPSSVAPQEATLLLVAAVAATAFSPLPSYLPGHCKRWTSEAFEPIT